MAQLTIGQFKALYGLTGSTFPDNILGLISEGDMRQFGEDIADSFVNIIESSPVFPNQDFDVTMSPWINASGSNRSGSQNFQWESGGFLRANGSPENTKYLAVTRTNGWPAGDYQILIRAKNDSTYGGSGGDAINIGAWSLTDPSNQTTLSPTVSGQLPRDNTFYTRNVAFTLNAPANYLAFTFDRAGGGGTFDVNVVVDSIVLNSYTPVGDVYATEEFVTNAIANIDISDLSGTITSNLIFETTAGLQFIVGENVTVADSSWSAFFGENHDIDGIFNDGIVAGEGHTSDGAAGNNAIFGRANSLTGTGGKYFNLLVGDSNVLFSDSGNQANGNFIMGINNELQDTDNSSVISGTNITGDADDTAYGRNVSLDGNFILQSSFNNVMVYIGDTSPNFVNGIDLSADQMALITGDMTIADDLGTPTVGLTYSAGAGILQLISGETSMVMTGTGTSSIVFGGDGFFFLNDVEVQGLITGQTAAANDVNYSGTIYKDTAQVGNVGTGDDTLKTYSLPGGTLDTNGKTLLITAAGTFANTANNKRLRLKFGSDTIFDSGALAITTAADWVITSEIIRTGAATQKCITKLTTSSAVLTTICDYAAATQTLNSPVAIAVTGEATADNDIVSELFIIRFEP